MSQPAPHHLVIGGQRSGKSRHAERLANAWQAQSPEHSVMVVATAWAGDDEMRERIERHRRDRPASFGIVEAGLDLAVALREAAQPGRLLVLDCLTLWLTQLLMPAQAHPAGALTHVQQAQALQADLIAALRTVASPVVVVSNEVGWGVIPLSAEVRHFVDELGRLNQAVAQCCAHITLMAAGQPFTQAVQPIHPLQVCP